MGNSDRQEKIGGKILNAFEKRKGFYTNYKLESKNSENWEKDRYLNYVTFVSSVDYQKAIKADKLWKQAKKWGNDYPWLFMPPEFLKKSASEVAEVFQKIREETPAVFMPRDAGIWLLIARSLKTIYKGKTSTLLKKFNYDAKQIYDKLRKRKDEDGLKENFPFLSGDKILPTWLKILKEDANQPMKNMEKIPLPVDKDVARVTYNLFFKKEPPPKKIGKKVTDRVREKWNEIANGLNRAVIDFDTPLWLLGGKKGCAKQKKGCTVNHCPVKEFCSKQGEI